ncbi:MAG: radical SAM protein [Candidatus Omnitrophica bacterium]|nr:radical SAM protein [Candidatus Omnitrophota bacterium]
MKVSPCQYFYGPFDSWRIGRSLGVDPLSDSVKICNLDCIYCQLGHTHHLTNERAVYVSTERIRTELSMLPAMLDIDYITFSGRGEPTLAANLGDMIRAVKDYTSYETAVITNGTLLYQHDVRRDVGMADLVIAKLDAFDERSFRMIDQALDGISFEQTLTGLRNFQSAYWGTLAIQVMFVAENLHCAEAIARLVRDIGPDEVQINTPLRPSVATPLSPEGIARVKELFHGMPAVTVYDRPRKEDVNCEPQHTVPEC